MANLSRSKGSNAPRLDRFSTSVNSVQMKMWELTVLVYRPQVLIQPVEGFFDQFGSWDVVSGVEE
jgi:hypothetical protein